MQWLGYGILGFAPGLFWLWFLRSKDRIEPEPRALVLRAFALGCLAPALILAVRPRLEALLPGEFGTARLLLDAFVVTALCEELAKAAALCAGVLFHRELDEPLDGIVYGGAAALGFASVENVFFLIANDAPALALQRGFTTTLLHIVCTGSIGLLIARARLAPRGSRAREIALLFAVAAGAVLVHGAYDAFVLAGVQAGRIAIAVVLPLGVSFFAWLLRRAMRESSARGVR